MLKLFAVCLTYTSCSTVHIHSFHKKYIFLYTAFTVSYNRAVTGFPYGRFFFLFDHDLQCPQSTNDPLTQQSCYNVTHDCVFSLLQPAVSDVSLQLEPCFVSVALAPFAASATLSSSWHDSVEIIHALSYLSVIIIILARASVTSTLWFPANVRSTECRHNPPLHQTAHPPLPRCCLSRCPGAPSVQGGSEGTARS